MRKRIPSGVVYLMKKLRREGYKLEEIRFRLAWAHAPTGPSLGAISKYTKNLSRFDYSPMQELDLENRKTKIRFERFRRDTSKRFGKVESEVRDLRSSLYLLGFWVNKSDDSVRQLHRTVTTDYLSRTQLANTLTR